LLPYFIAAVAEGIEEAIQDEMLTEMGCQYAQGYYFSKPISVDEMSELLSQQS